MLAVLAYAFRAIMPIILLILVGVLARRTGFLDPVTTRKLNRFNFRFNFMAMMFVNIYGVESIRQMPLRMGLFCIASLSVMVLLSIVLSGILTKERFRRGVLMQSLFRSNYAVIGLAVVTSLVGEEGARLAAFLQLPVVMLFNLASVTALSVFCDYEAQYRLYGEGPLAETGGDAAAAGMQAQASGGVDFRQVLKRIITNPLIQGLLLGFAALLIRELLPAGADGEKIFSLQRDVSWFYSPLQSLARVATPLALIVLGAQLEMSEIRGFKKELIAGVLMRLVLAPALGFSMLFLAVKAGWVQVGPPEIAVLLSIYGSPQAVSSIVMSAEMGGDSHLAGQIVVWSSIFGMWSLFVLIFIMRSIGLL